MFVVAVECPELREFDLNDTLTSVRGEIVQKLSDTAQQIMSEKFTNYKVIAAYQGKEES